MVVVVEFAKAPIQGILANPTTSVIDPTKQKLRLDTSAEWNQKNEEVVLSINNGKYSNRWKC